MFLVDLPDPAIRIERVLDTIDSSMPGGHAIVAIDDLRVPADQMLGEAGEGFKYAQVRLSPGPPVALHALARRRHRAQEIATDYACRRQAFGKVLIDHEGVGFMLAENLIDLKQAELMIDWCADVLDTGSLGTAESSMAKVAVSEALMRVADRCVQVMGGTGVTDATRSSSRCSARSAPSASMTARPRSTNGRWPRRSSATGRPNSIEPAVRTPGHWRAQSFAGLRLDRGGPPGRPRLSR